MFISNCPVCCTTVPAGSPSRGGDVTVHVKDINQPSMPTPFYSVLVSVSVFMALSAVFHSINLSYNFPFSHSVLPIVYSFALLALSTVYLLVKVSFSHDKIHTNRMSSKRQLINCCTKRVLRRIVPVTLCCL